MLLWLYLLLRSMGLRGWLVTGILVLVIGILALAFPDSAHLIVIIGFIVIVVIGVIEVLRR